MEVIIITTLTEKYTLHIPHYKKSNNKVIQLNKTQVLSCLQETLHQHGYTEYYTTEASGTYQKNTYTQTLLTIYTTKSTKNKPIPEIFIEWFKQNNNYLQQESIAYEHNNQLHIQKI